MFTPAGTTLETWTALNLLVPQPPADAAPNGSAMGDADLHDDDGIWADFTPLINFDFAVG